MPSEMVEFVRTTVKSDRNQKWQRFDPAQLARIIPEVAEQMTRNGYEIPDEVIQLARRGTEKITRSETLVSA
jgi:hypothetical protein